MAATESVDLLVIGAGPSGLALCHNHTGDHLILEKANGIGGLSRSFEIEGGIFDVGGHSFHTPHPHVREFVTSLMKGQWATQARDARVWFEGTMIPYPFQRYFDLLPDAHLVAKCLNTRPQHRTAATAENFEEWIQETFGEGIADAFMLPYNRKLWARSLREISCDWVGNRVASAAPSSPAPGKPMAEKGSRQPLEPGVEIGYPAAGGFQTIFDEMAKGVRRIEFGQCIVRIDARERIAHTAQGSAIRWQRLVSTIPLPALIRSIDGAPPDLALQTSELEAVSLMILMIVVGKQLRDCPQRVYVCDAVVPAHKVAFNHTSSAALGARPVHAVMAEISYSVHKPLPPKADLASQTIDWLSKAGLIPDRADVIRVDHLPVPLGYPVPTHKRAEIVSQARSYLATLGIHTLGRFGEWEYINSDECIHKAMALAAELNAH